ncbi:bifunctional heparan sulfate N-deacetylase/N-sulfotransferase 2-like [Xenia sp. Carnegie-2017]|uniref:bifunctional heparan sulfate N-deacetylase/N-sulfotransferase 2-like n=1 Tax=Xenia sp. Carnegie-2017 TaxID=2897299 RepID=UPI001F03DA00|nr:bifunctional heparan sulfate N-deacetylase/N-sulfotransferase 2-like [Xenia sp. Carnegie-2017]
MQFNLYHVSANASMLRLVTGNNMLDFEESHMSSGEKWSIFLRQNARLHEHFEIVATSSFHSTIPIDNSMYSPNLKFPVVLHDLGQLDKIQRIYFGAGLSFWPHKLLFLDALGYMSSGKLAKSLDRWIQVDIDDIFVGRSGIRMKADDVQALVSAQKSLQKMVPGFQFNLGFSGKYFKNGNEEENAGDEELIKNAHKFRWFCHTWAHKQPHKVNTLDEMKSLINLNMEFAKKHKIPVDNAYSISPHHSGVYPVHEILYEVWGKTIGVQVTSTEEYPHLKPAWRRRGFIHRDIMVLPRQMCGLFTHTLHLHAYPRGKEVLLKSIYGGELFNAIVSNPINIFMTHLSNYGNDRLALYTFHNVIKFIKCWTTLRVMSLSPLELGKKYFELFPSERQPVWHNPCKDPRHREIWPSWKSCSKLPSFLIVGPQKTGTTALHMFLSVHPQLRHNKKNEISFEETQFFSSVNYLKGLDWYLDNFDDVHEDNSTLLFEKTANYFDSRKTPSRAFALLPQVKILIILKDPVKRAYSWFQHMRSHDDFTAININFYDLLTSKDNTSSAVKNLKARCLTPGLYAEHLERWMQYYPASQILTIDGEQLLSDPVSLLLDVQMFIGVTNVLDYSNILKYNNRKGFFCLTKHKYNGHTCLGTSKGRRYPPMAEKAEKHLRGFFKEPNRRLAEILHKIRQPLPLWLRSDVS